MTIGMLMATFIVSLMTLFDEAQFLAWGWRIPFLLSSVLVFSACGSVKISTKRPPLQVKNPASGEGPLRDTLKHHWREVLIAAGLKVVRPPLLYLLHLCSQLRHHHPELSKSQALESVTGRAGGHRDDPADGAAVDKVGRQDVHPERGAAGAVYRPVVPAARHRHRLGIMLATIVAFGILWAPVTAVLGTLCSEIFSANVRYTGITLGYQLGAALAGAPRRLSPPVCWQNMTGLAAGGRLSGRYGGDFAAGDILRQPDEVRVGHGPPGRKAPDRRPPATTAPTIPPGGAALARAGKSRRGKPLIPSGSMGPVRRQPPPGTNRRQVFPCLAGRRAGVRRSGCPAEAALAPLLQLPEAPQRDKPQRRSQQRQQRVRVKIMMKIANAKNSRLTQLITTRRAS